MATMEQAVSLTDDNRSNTNMLATRTVVATVFGVFLYLAVPLPSAWSIAVLPLICGTFAWIAVKDDNLGAVSAASITAIGSVILWPKIQASLPQLTFGFFLIIQIVLAVAPSLAAKLAKVRVNPQIIALSLLVVVMLNFILVANTSSVEISQASAYEPSAEAYGFDGIFFLKMFYLTEQGMDYYKAYDAGFQQDSRFDRPPSIIGGWRMPTTFWFWSLIADRGDHLVTYFIMLTLVLMLCAYLIAEKFAEPPFAVISACFIGTYMLFGVSSWWYTELEYWGMFLAIPAATLYLYDKRYYALPLAVLAGLMREWVALLLVAGLIDSLVKRRWLDSGVWAAACAFVGGAYVFNINNIMAYAKQTNLPLSLEGAGAGQGGISFILYTLQFGASHFAGGLNLVYVLFFVGIIGAILGGARSRNFYWATVILLPLAAFMYYGSGKVPGDPAGWNDYYNINFMPYILIAVPFAARPLIDIGSGMLQKLGSDHKP